MQENSGLIEDIFVDLRSLDFDSWFYILMKKSEECFCYLIFYFDMVASLFIILMSKKNSLKYLSNLEIIFFKRHKILLIIILILLIYDFSKKKLYNRPEIILFLFFFKTTKNGCNNDS